MLSIVLAALSLVATNAPRSDEAQWTPVVSYDELRIDVDTARVAGTGPFSISVQWTFLDRASSPSSWDAGVRRTVDRVEVDCAAGALRTLGSVAYGASGTWISGSSFELATAPWRVPNPESVGGELTSRVCSLLKARR